MEPITLDAILFEPDVDALRARLHVQAGTDDAAELDRLLADAHAVARPRAMYGMAFIDAKGDDTVDIEGVRFTSRVLRVNLDAAHRVFPYMATCGAELDAWAHSLDDILHQFWAEAIKEAALRDATRALNDAMEARFRPGKTTTMNPGSLADWPLREQRPFFTLMGDPHAAIGVSLSDSCLMSPNKSVSGIRFPTEGSFESCQLCPREGCPGRRADFDPGLWERYE
jgi:hypothetical protein